MKKVTESGIHLTVDGRRVIVYDTNSGGNLPVHASIVNKDGSKLLREYTSCGRVKGAISHNHPENIDVEKSINIGDKVFGMKQNYPFPIVGILIDIRREGYVVSSVDVRSDGERINELLDTVGQVSKDSCECIEDMMTFIRSENECGCCGDKIDEDFIVSKDSFECIKDMTDFARSESKCDCCCDEIDEDLIEDEDEDDSGDGEKMIRVAVHGDDSTIRRSGVLSKDKLDEIYKILNLIEDGE